MQDDGCKSLHGFLHGIECIMFHDHLDNFKKSPLGGRLNIELGDHGTPSVHNRWFILFYFMYEASHELKLMDIAFS